MSRWPSARARTVLAALLRSGWDIKRQSGSHRILSKEGSADYIFAFHDREEIGPRMLARIARRTGLRPGDLRRLAAAIWTTLEQQINIGTSDTDGFPTPRGCLGRC